MRTKILRFGNRFEYMEMENRRGEVRKSDWLSGQFELRKGALVCRGCCEDKP